MDDTARDELRRSVAQRLEGATPRPPVAMPSGQPGGSVPAPGGLRPPGAPAATDAAARPELPASLDSKDFVWAEVGRAVIIASSQEMLDRAVQAYNGQYRSLAEDPAYTAMQAMMSPADQNLVMVNLSAIMQAVRPHLWKAMGREQAAMVDDLVHLFGLGDAGLVASGRYDGRVSSGTAFLPLNYERAIHLFGAALRDGGGTRTVPVAMR